MAPQSKPQKRRVQTPHGLIDAEVKEPMPNVNFPEGPCPLVHGPCCKDPNACGFWTESLGLERTVIGTERPVIIGSCIFYATMNIAMTPKIIQATGQQPPNLGGGKFPAS